MTSRRRHPDKDLSFVVDDAETLKRLGDLTGRDH